MGKAITSFNTKLKNLEAVRLSYGESFAPKRLALLSALARIKPPNDAQMLRRYHEILLFISAFPDNGAVYKSAEKSLKKLGKYISSLDLHSPVITALADSGMEGTVATESFSRDAWLWLSTRNGAKLQLNAKDGSYGEKFDEFLQSTLLHAAADSAINSDVSTEELLRLKRKGIFFHPWCLYL